MGDWAGACVALPGINLCGDNGGEDDSGDIGDEDDNAGNGKKSHF